MVEELTIIKRTHGAQLNLIEHAAHALILIAAILEVRHRIAPALQVSPMGLMDCEQALISVVVNNLGKSVAYAPTVHLQSAR